MKAGSTHNSLSGAKTEGTKEIRRPWEFNFASHGKKMVAEFKNAAAAMRWCGEKKQISREGTPIICSILIFLFLFQGLDDRRADGWAGFRQR